MTPCIEWPGSRFAQGYGQIHIGGRSRVAHRFLWELYRGPVPDGLVLDHLCRNRLCVNLDHLEVVTQRENVLRGVGPTAVNAARTHCSYGHLLDFENTYTDGQRRRCRECGNRRTREYKARQQARSAA